jgi:hypothetical protein
MSDEAKLEISVKPEGKIKIFLKSLLSRKFLAVIIFGVYAYLVLLMHFTPPDSVTVGFTVIIAAYAGIEGARDIKGTCAK